MTPGFHAPLLAEQGLRGRFAVVATAERIASAVAAFDPDHRGAWAAGADPSKSQLVRWKDMEMLHSCNIIDVKTPRGGAAG
jgi:hypothetical protein